MDDRVARINRKCTGDAMAHDSFQMEQHLEKGWRPSAAGAIRQSRNVCAARC